jgi:hypothetical protein
LSSARSDLRHAAVDEQLREIAGLDDRVPLILQLNRLRDDQLIELVRATDPLASARR